MFRFDRLQTFFDAVRAGNVDRVKKIGSKIPDVLNQQEKSSKMTPIQLAAHEGHLEVVELLLQHGANPTQGNRPARHQTHALFYAEQQGHIHVADSIWNWLAKHRKHTKEAQKLCKAIKAEDIDLVEELLEEDHSLANATEFGEASGFNGGDPVLLFAIQYDRPRCVELLIGHGADLESHCVRGRSPIQMALSYLVGFGYRSGLDKELELEKRTKVVKVLLKAGVNRDLWVESCLGNLSEVQAIVNVDPEAVNRTVNPSQASGGFGMDHYPLTGAIGGQHMDIAAYLLEHGADPNTPFQLTGYNHLDFGAPLEIATRNEHIGLVRLLLDHGANPNTSRHACSNAVDTAFASGNQEIIALLLENGGKRNRK